ncbi:hypothetical protein AGMMS49574_01030 [Bacteroidia bacterium]|nr:hypothetical protein AGMMS49574_01030 [Bacteroidia bacterium]
MKKNALFSAIISSVLLVLVFFSSCNDNITGDIIDKPKADIAVHTRSTGNRDVQGKFPVHVYVFGSEDKCVGYQMLENGSNFNFKLPIGKYTLYALCGANPEKYIIPNWEGAKKTDPLVLLADSVHSELEAGSADVTLEIGKSQELNLYTRHVVAQISAYISDVPEKIKEVKMMFQPVRTTLGINGLFIDEGNGETSIQLTPDSIKGGWHTKDTMFIFPSTINKNITIGIELTSDEGTTKYSYGTTAPLKANYIYDIVATYISDSGGIGSPELGGTITGSDWEGKEDIFFGFNENGIYDIYKPGNFYQDRLILKMDKLEEGIVNLYLMTRWQGHANSTNNPSTWEPPTSDSELITEDMAKFLNKLWNADYKGLNARLKEKGNDPMDDSYKQVCYDKDKKVRKFGLKGEFKLEDIGKSVNYKVRGFDVVRIKYK